MSWDFNNILDGENEMYEPRTEVSILIKLPNLLNNEGSDIVAAIEMYEAQTEISILIKLPN